MSELSATEALTDANPQAKAHLARPAVRDVPGLRRDHPLGAGEVADRGAEEIRRPERVRAQDLAPPRWGGQAAVSQDRLQAAQGRGAGEGRADRVRPQPL